MSLTAVPAWAPCEAVVPNWLHFLSSKELHKNAAANPTTLAPSATENSVRAWRTVKGTSELRGN